MRCITVGDVKKALENIPDDMPVYGTAHDCGGYDAILSDVVVVRQDDGRVFIAGEDE